MSNLLLYATTSLLNPVNIYFEVGYFKVNFVN